jgi:thiamine-phosphate pyrophosphorylase
MRPRVIQITSLPDLSERDVLARVGAIRPLDAEARAAFAVQLREPELTSRALLTFGQRLRDATRAVGAALVVNDRVDVALAIGADGVHLGRRSMAVRDARALLPAGMWISVACHDVADLVAASAAGAEAGSLSPIFASPGKGRPLGVEALHEARRAVPPGFAIIALGGVTVGNARDCLLAGADAVASIRADLTALLREGSLDAPSRPC